MRYKVVEYWPGFVERRDEPREAIINSLAEIDSISWVKKDWEVVRGEFLREKRSKLVRANIYPCE